MCRHDDKIVLCQNEKESNCYEMVLGKLRLDQQKYCPRSCLTREYQARHVRNYENSQGPFGYLSSNQSATSVKFAVPYANTNLRDEQPFKIVNTEYLVMSGMILVGNVGGMLGLFVGFSFLGSCEWLLGVFPQIRIWMNKKSLRKQAHNNEMAHEK